LPFVAGVLEGGVLVLTGSPNPAGRAAPGVEETAMSVALAGTGDGDGVVRAIGSFSGPVWEYTELNGQLGRQRLAFSGATQVTNNRWTVFVGLPDRFEVRAYDSDGNLTRVFRRSFVPTKVEAADVQWLLERRLAEVDGEEARRLVRQAFRELRRAEAMPGFGVPVWPGGAAGGPGMVVDDEGNLWVFDYYRPGAYANEWTVFSAEGIWLGSVTLPDRLEPSQIGRDFVLGRWEDDVGLVRVRRHTLVKP
jgi:hypothetical protein